MLDLLYRRRSIRKYKSEKIDSETVQKLIKAALLSPSSRGFQPWQYPITDIRGGLAVQKRWIPSRMVASV